MSLFNISLRCVLYQPCSLNDIILHCRYREAVKIRQRLLRDQPEHPLDRAIYWTEYVLRHKGAYHLQSPAREYSFIQYYLIDVYMLLLAATIISAFTIIKITKFMISFMIIFFQFLVYFETLFSFRKYIQAYNLSLIKIEQAYRKA